MKKILLKLEDIASSGFIKKIFSLFKLLISIGFTGHWIACWFYYIGLEDSETFPIAWFNAYKQDTLYERYVT